MVDASLKRSVDFGDLFRDLGLERRREKGWSSKTSAAPVPGANVRTKLLLYEAFVTARGAPLRLLPAAVNYYFHPVHPAIAPRTVWSLYNSVTEALKNIAARPGLPKRRAGGPLLRDATGVAEGGDLDEEFPLIQRPTRWCGLGIVPKSIEQPVKISPRFSVFIKGEHPFKNSEAEPCELGPMAISTAVLL
ncbi:MAG: hypothetical protein HYR55_11445 [Acidobacteria bacterium]|nr:hypothetical protein [Acidobacteriota bacterium]